MGRKESNQTNKSCEYANIAAAVLRHAKFPQEKIICHFQTPQLYRVCRSNHELNRQLGGRAINCNVTYSLRPVSSKVK